ncbi:MAG: permease-like cell division protein FtsX [Actinomycetota bacterium]|nr:permease-like cell division protein FtsX [Actinomycetota bacterium]
MRALFVLSEVWIGLRRNLTMAFSVVMVTAISLAIFGAGLLIREQINTMKTFWYDKVEVSVFLTKEVTPAQREEIKKDLDALPEVERLYYESQADAYKRFVKQFEDSPDLVKNVREDALPESYRVKLTDPEKYAVVERALQFSPGVYEVQDQRQILDRFFRVLNAFQFAALVTAIVLLVVAVVLISVTIRVAAFNRRRETGIMRLVGASNFYISLPFVLEGAIAGLIGAGLASLALAAFQWQFIENRFRETIPAINFIGWEELLGVIPVLLVLGVGLASVASLVTLRRHLKV